MSDSFSCHKKKWIVNVKLRVVFTDEDDILSHFGKGIAYIEIPHLTMRIFNRVDVQGAGILEEWC